jgi:universal stress protein E
MQRFQNILLVFNGSDLSDPAVQRALTLARANDARLTVVDVISINAFSRSLEALSEKIDRLHEQICQDRHQAMEDLFYEPSREMNICVKVLHGKPFLEIIRYVLENNCDLVIKSSEQEKRFSSILFGSTDLQLLRKCPCPVWIVKPDDSPQSRRILAAIDLEAFHDENELDQLNRQIVEIGTSLAFYESSELNIVNAWIVFGEKLLEKKLAKLYEDDVASWMSEQKNNINSAQEKFLQLFKEHLTRNGMEGLECRFHFIEGEAEEVILDFAVKQKIDLVVMGTVGRTDLAGFFVGNTSEAILNQINCSVLAVKPSGFISPVTLDNT